jgi:hypothetical protein
MEQREQDPAVLEAELAALQAPPIKPGVARRQMIANVEDHLYQSAIARVTPEEKGSRKFRRALRANVRRHVSKNLSRRPA